MPFNPFIFNILKLIIIIIIIIINLKVQKYENKCKNEKFDFFTFYPKI